MGLILTAEFLAEVGETSSWATLTHPIGWLQQQALPAFSYTFPAHSVTAIKLGATPKTKDECKTGGYESFSFKNQGQCIAFVNRAT
jgi:hypothetical protein